MLFVVNLLYQRFGAIFMSIHQFVKLFCLNYQAYSPTLLVGKLSKILKEKNVAVLGVFYWVISVLTGTNSPHPFGLPFNSVLRIKCIDDKDIIIEVNEDWKKTPFQIKGNCSIIENYFISPKGYKKKWLFLEVLPIFILMSLVFLLFFLVLEGIEELYILKTLFWSVVIISEIAWCMYVYKVLKK